MKLGSASAAIVIAALAMVEARAQAADVVSWGRAGVSLADYRADGVACAREGADADIRGERATGDFVAADRLLERNLNLPTTENPDDLVYGPGSVGMLRRRLQPDRRIAELQRTLVGVTERCLRNRGYVAFRLTRDQDRRLRRLDRGSDARRAYLHALASDPSVLASQQIEDAPGRSRD